MYQKCGTLHYMGTLHILLFKMTLILLFIAPEIVRNQHEYSKLCDVWSMGVIMYTLYASIAAYLTHNQLKLVLLYTYIEARLVLF